ncbi:MAG TPA: hypothetical protein PKH07_19760, partial [bacterium]|nr:hypothetical protein [bacterium]
MKSSVAVAMIVCGTILIAMPYIHNMIAMQQVAAAMVALNTTVNLTADIPKHADEFCMFGGIVMIVVGAVAGLRN